MTESDYLKLASDLFEALFDSWTNFYLKHILPPLKQNGKGEISITKDITAVMFDLEERVFKKDFGHLKLAKNFSQLLFFEKIL